MPERAFTALVGAAALVASTSIAAAAVPTVPEPTIPPGYQPKQTRDERGLWLELDDYEKSVARSPLRIRASALTKYVEDMVCRIADDYCGDFRVYVVRNPYFNASMAANGMMQVWTGLLTRMASESELAVVIGHEIAHYELAHALAQFRKIKKGMAVGSIFDFGLLVVGVPIPVGQMAATLDVLAFSRKEESEAEFLGVRLMAAAGYDPHASYRVWHNVIEEDRRAERKREGPGLFSKTHPDVDARADELQRWVEATYGAATRDATPSTDFRDLLAGNIDWMMEDQIKTGRFGRTEYVLEHQEAIGLPAGWVHFFRAEMLQQRAKEGDLELARGEYEQAIVATNPPPKAFRNLGYLLLKQDDVAAARANFARYLELLPEADDRAMVEFYLSEEP